MHLRALLGLTSVAAIALAVSTGLATAASPPPSHVLTIRLPDGQVEQIRYSGDVPPAIMIGPGGAAMPGAVEPFAADPAFAALDRMEAMMGQQSAAMLREADAMAHAAFAGADRPIPAALDDIMRHGMTPGEFSSAILVGDGAGNICTRSVTITALNGQAPHVVSHTSGNCGAAGGAATPAQMPDVTPPPANHAPLLRVRASGAHPYANLVRPIPVWSQPATTR
jgi:hypothetical protein